MDAVEQTETGIMSEGGAEIHLQSTRDLLQRTDDEGRQIDESLILRVEMIETIEAIVLVDQMAPRGLVSDEMAVMTDEMIE